MKSGKKYTEKQKLVDNQVKYTVAEAVDLLKKTARAKFDETVDLAMHLGVDPKKSDQGVRGTFALPAGTGKKIKIVVLTKGDKYKEAEEAGADAVGAEDLVEKISAGWLDFDLVLATPDIMSQVGKLGKVLGKKGLMPSPKAGTVAMDIGKAVREFKAGKLEFKMDKTGNIHLGIGKISFDEKSLKANITAAVEAINKAKPSALKGIFMKSATVSTTMGPGIKLNVSKLAKELED
ncbi:MAG: 50S ribosomal protein L1 [Candidatus Saganbacteria bacterium]|nr:50S ribosomal protein L1 [Candidatus Saganbacteria bacterium]